jgi:RNA polymerase sigma-70 factor (ECF subfamily)
MSDNDASLIQATLAGDTNAFGQLVRKYQGAVYGIAVHIIGDFTEAQDIAQEVFIKAYIDLWRLRTPAKFASWLHGITVNVCKMWHRKHKRLDMLNLDHPEARQALEQQTVEAPDEIYESQELSQVVLKALSNLSEKNRLVVTLYYLDGLTQCDISEFLNVSITTVETRLYRARNQLKEEMMDMVERVLEDNKLSEEFSNKVVAELLTKPGLLNIPNHPLTQMWKSIQTALPEYTVVGAGPEIEPIDINKRILGEEGYSQASIIEVDTIRMLRYHTTPMLLQIAHSQSPPLRLLSVGRCFRDDRVCEKSNKIFHQVEGLWLDVAINEALFRQLIDKMLQDVLGITELRWRRSDEPYVIPGWEVDVYMAGEWLPIMGAGCMTPDVLKKIVGCDPERFTCYGFGLSLERFTMIKRGIKDIRDFWK